VVLTSDDGALVVADQDVACKRHDEDGPVR
jgi:hypothetical protein